MNTTREQFLKRVREAVVEGNRVGAVPPLPERGTIGYQGAGSDPLTRFREEFAAAGGHTHIVADRAGAVAVILDLVHSRSARRVLMDGGAFLHALSVGEALRTAGVEVTTEANRAGIFQADLGVTGVDYLIAETGSVILTSQPEQPRSPSLLPPIHVAVAERRQILPDLFDLFEILETKPEELPACVSIITGPSKTGDIELRLVTGVHGPGEIHVVVIDSADSLS